MDVSRFRDVPVIDEEQWSVLVGAGDDDPRALLEELIALFKEDVEERLQPLSEADPLLERAEIQQHAHSIAGSGSNLAASRLAAIARWLEEAEDYSPDDFSEAVRLLLDTYAESLRELRERTKGL